MSTVNYEFWPFAAASVDAPVPQNTAQVAFLESAHAKGYDAFRFGINDFGARSKQREGCILQRGRTRWEFRLADGERRTYWLTLTTLRRLRGLFNNGLTDRTSVTFSMTLPIIW